MGSHNEFLTVPDDPIPRPLPHDQLICDSTKHYPKIEEDEPCYPLDLSETQGFTLKEIFGRAVQGTCLSTQGNETAPPPISISARDSLDVYTTGGVTERKMPGGSSRCLSIPQTGEFELLISKQDPAHFAPVSTPPLYAERSITGHGQERGGVRIILTNPSQTQNVSFVYFEALPWFMKPYMHTLKSSIHGAIREMYYRPGLDRKRGSQLELSITIPAASTLELSYDFEKAILRYTEYPPDANRGRDVAPAVIRLIDTDSNTIKGEYSTQGHKKTAYIRTTPLMLPLPTPDFSIPYNVIILTSTVIAVAFGTIYNMLIRQFVGADETQGMGVVAKVRAALQRLSGRLRGRVGAVDQKEGEKKVQ